MLLGRIGYGLTVVGNAVNLASRLEMGAKGCGRPRWLSG